MLRLLVILKRRSLRGVWVYIEYMKKKPQIYIQWQVWIKQEDYTIIEELRAETGLSRLEFFKMLVNEKYGTNL